MLYIYIYIYILSEEMVHTKNKSDEYKFIQRITFVDYHSIKKMITSVHIYSSSLLIKEEKNNNL